jgi:hypothetical protein
MAGPLLTFTNVSVWVFAVIFGAFTRNALEVTGLGALILYAVFWASDFSVTTLEITQQIELWYHTELLVVLLLGALSGQELSRMVQIPRLITFSTVMPFDFKLKESTVHDAASDWITQLFGLSAAATVLGINFWAGRTFGYPSGLSPIGTDLVTPGIILTIICVVLLALSTILLIFIEDASAALSSKYLWLAIPIPLASLIQTYAQYTWHWNNGWPEFLWYGLLIAAFLITIALALYIPTIVRQNNIEAQLVDPFYNSSSFVWIYFAILFAHIVIGSLLFNLIAMWRYEDPSFGSYILMGWSGFVILFCIIFGSAMFERLGKLPGYKNRYMQLQLNSGSRHIDLRTLIEEHKS